jgi:hypothetical protein
MVMRTVWAYVSCRRYSEARKAETLLSQSIVNHWVTEAAEARNASASQTHLPTSCRALRKQTAMFHVMYTSTTAATTSAEAKLHIQVPHGGEKSLDSLMLHSLTALTAAAQHRE